VDARGWPWTRSEIRHIQLLEWLAKQVAERPNIFAEVVAFYDERADQREKTFETAYGDLKLLEEQRLIQQASGLGGIESLAAMVTPQGHALLEELRARRADRQQRRMACRDATVAWLYSADATSAAAMLTRGAMLEDPRYGCWLAEPFGPAELAEASGWLHDQGMVAGPTVEEDAAPLHLYLTLPGLSCAEAFDCDTRRYVNRHAGSAVSGNITNIFGNHNNVQAASPGASLTVVQAITREDREQSVLLAQAVEQAQSALGPAAVQAAFGLRAAVEPEQSDPGVLRKALGNLRDALVIGSSDIVGKAILGIFAGLLAHYGIPT
jgi:hypothetical protein